MYLTINNHDAEELKSQLIVQLHVSQLLMIRFKIITSV